MVARQALNLKILGSNPSPGAYYYILDFPLRFPPRRFAARRQNGANFRDIFRPQGEKNLTNNKVKIYGQIFSLRQKINR